ncbi:MAG: MerR family transcriptional regulator [Proteobacteria bacterium]|nr:MerR family transcriptional regulator [Pseudomonadota bacterium]MCP4922295.1 MerR family transcriptional regulator [Pseudomonadota bacterium]
MAYKIKTVAELTGIPKNTLIAWERRYGLPQPARTDSGYRIYSDADVELLRRILGLREVGYRISEIVDLLAREDAAGAAQLERGDVGGGLAGLRDGILGALLRFDLVDAEDRAKALVTVPFATQLDSVYMPMLQETGHRWERGEATVVQEHLVSGWCRERILTMARSVEPGAANAPEAICASPAGERHEFGLLGVAFHLASAGYRVVYLGADVPGEQLLALVSERQPAIVALSAVLDRPGFDLWAFATLVAERLASQGRVLLGGRAAAALEGRSTARILVGDKARRVTNPAARPHLLETGAG